MNGLLFSLLRIGSGVIVGIPVLLYSLLYFRQDAMLFHPRPLDAARVDWIRNHYPGSEFSITTEEDITLRGWLKKVPEKGPLLIYFGGNSEEVSTLLGANLPPAWSLLLVNYRGYGASDGDPSEAALFHDALAIYDRVQARFPAIAVMGRSLGTGVAVYLASRRPLCGAVLVSPYDSIRSLAQAIYPYAPVRWLLKHPFDAESYAPTVTTPVFALIADQDRIIPPVHSHTLLAAWGGRVTTRHFPAANHQSIAEQPDYWPSIHRFLQHQTACHPPRPMKSS